MRDRRDLAMMKRLADVQRAQRVGAEAALGEAAEAEREARRAQEAALAKSRAAHRQWAEYLAEPGFSPEFSRALCAQVIEREAAADEAGSETARRREAHEMREQEWQRLEAQVRQSETSVRRLGRRVARKQDETAMSALSDRITWSWSRA